MILPFLTCGILLPLFGDADSTLENEVYKLKKDEISQVISAGSGFYIVKVLHISQNKYVASMQQNALRQYVIDVLRLRKERARLDEYMAEALKDKKGYSIPKTFYLLVEAMADVYFNKQHQHNALFSPEVLNDVRTACANILSDTLCVVGGSFWSVGDVIDKLMNKLFTADTINRAALPHIINTQIQILVQQELLEQEALRRGLDQQPGVKEKYNIWRDAILASSMKEYVQSIVSVPDDEIYASIKNNNPAFSLPQVKLRWIKTATINEMTDAINKMRNGIPLEKIFSREVSDSSGRILTGETDFFDITENPPLGEIAWKMETGETYGPMVWQDGILFFQLLEKKEQAAHDTVFLSFYNSMKKRLHTMKAKKLLNSFLAQTAYEKSVGIYEDRLKQISVTPIPMMTYRILGFGGRMFEVPFVDPQTEWLNVEPPKTKVLP